MRWCQRDSFWQANILSTAKFREKFDQLELKMEKNGRPIKKSRADYKPNRRDLATAPESAFGTEIQT
jgi:hypothetical protein